MAKGKYRDTIEEAAPIALPDEITPVAPGAVVVPEPVAEVVAPVEPVAPVVTVEPSDLMPLRVFATLAGPKWDQMAGFVAWATRQQLGPRSMTAWREAHETFKTRPVG
jgi:hypothetical protein